MVIVIIVKCLPISINGVKRDSGSGIEVPDTVLNKKWHASQLHMAFWIMRVPQLQRTTAVLCCEPQATIVIRELIVLVVWIVATSQSPTSADSQAHHTVCERNPAFESIS